jgi:hypothetical protein
MPIGRPYIGNCALQRDDRPLPDTRTTSAA